MLILTPPSEGKSSLNSSTIKFSDTEFMFNSQVTEILSLLRDFKKNELTSIYGTSLEKATLLHQQNLNVFNSECSLAIERYTGIVFKNLDWKSLDDKSQSYINNNLRILSGLFGIIKPNTLIPNYKLKMEVLSLANFWKPILSQYIQNEELILDLLPVSHRKALNPHNNLIKINFMIEKNGKLTQSAHAGKVVKGKFIRFLAENTIEKIDGIQYFKEDGYNWDGTFFIKR